MRNLDYRLKKLERAIGTLNAIYVVFVEPPEGVEIDNRTVFRSEADITPEFRKQHGEFALFKGLDPDCV